MPGLVPSEAETETDNGVRLNVLEGTANGVGHEVEAPAGGAVREIEQEHGDDDDDEEDDGAVRRRAGVFAA